ncbi:hypothetical protein KEM54_005923 [Ascosphaera aggregata]|nr:hypothetical protein KEM54_005923 [Ascosphaera aggregata]
MSRSRNDKKQDICSTCQTSRVECEWPEVNLKQQSNTTKKKERNKTRRAEGGTRKQLKEKKGQEEEEEEEEEEDDDDGKKRIERKGHDEHLLKQFRTKSVTKKDFDISQSGTSTPNSSTQEEEFNPEYYHHQQEIQQKQSLLHPALRNSRSSPTPDSAYNDIYHVHSSDALDSSSSSGNDNDGASDDDDYDDDNHARKKRVLHEQSGSRKRRKVNNTTDRSVSPSFPSKQDPKQSITAPPQSADTAGPEKENHHHHNEVEKTISEMKHMAREEEEEEKPLALHHVSSLNTPAPKHTQPRRSLSRPSITPRLSLAFAATGAAALARGRRSARLNKGYSSTEDDEDSNSDGDGSDTDRSINNTRMTPSVLKTTALSSEKVDDIQGEKSEGTQEELPFRAQEHRRDEDNHIAPQSVPTTQSAEGSQVPNESKGLNALGDSIMTRQDDEHEEIIQPANPSSSTDSQQAPQRKPATIKMTNTTTLEKQSVATAEAQPKSVPKLSRAQRRKSARMQHLDSRPTHSASSRTSADNQVATVPDKPTQVKTDDKGLALPKVISASIADEEVGERQRSPRGKDGLSQLVTHHSNASRPVEAPETSPAVGIHSLASTNFHEYAHEDEPAEKEPVTDNVQSVDKGFVKEPRTKTIVDHSELTARSSEPRPRAAGESSRFGPQDPTLERTTADVEMTVLPPETENADNMTARNETAALREVATRAADDPLQRILDQLVVADAGYLGPADEESSEEGAEINVNHRYLNMPGKKKTRTLPADGPTFNPDHSIFSYARKEGRDGEKHLSEGSEQFQGIPNHCRNELTYEGGCRHAVYQRSDLKNEAGQHYHKNNMINEMNRRAWKQQYIDRLPIPFDFMNYITQRPEAEFWADFNPYLMNHHCLIPLFKQNPLPPLNRPYESSAAYSSFSDFHQADPLTMNVAANAMRYFICIAIGSLQRSPHDYERASQFFNVARSARDILFHCDPLVQAQAMVLSVQYFIMLMHYDEAWVTLGTAIRICQKERWDQPNETRQLERIHCEERRRAWWACILLERHLAMHMGLRPSTPFNSTMPLSSRQQCNYADDSCDQAWDVMSAYPDDKLARIWQTDDPMMEGAKRTFDLTDSFFFKLYFEQACFIDRIIENQDDLRFDGNLAKGIEKFLTFDMGKLRKLEQDLWEWKKRIPPHKLTIDGKQQGAIPNEACVNQGVTLTWWNHYLRVRLTRPFFALVISDSIHDTRKPNPSRPEPTHRLSTKLNEFDCGIIRQYALQCFNTARVIVTSAVENTSATAEGRMESILPRHLMIPFVYEATKVLILSDALDESMCLELNYADKQELVDQAVILLTEYYAAPPVGQLCALNLEMMRAKVDQIINDGSAEVVNFPDPVVLEGLPYDLRDTRTLS